MLILKRTHNKDSAVRIADNITLQVVNWDRGYRTVALAFFTTEPVRIRREEVTELQSVTPKAGNLVLTRKKGQSVIVGDNIKITVLDADASTIKVGIDAPKEIPILRVEAKEIGPSSLEEI
jgi:carbon storage regulator